MSEKKRIIGVGFGQPHQLEPLFIKNNFNILNLSDPTIDNLVEQLPQDLSTIAFVLINFGLVQTEVIKSLVGTLLDRVDTLRVVFLVRRLEELMEIQELDLDSAVKVLAVGWPLTLSDWQVISNWSEEEI